MLTPLEVPRRLAPASTPYLSWVPAIAWIANSALLIMLAIGTAAVIVAVIAVAFQLLVSGLEREFYLTQLTMTAYYSLIVVGLCLLMGFAGQISLGHAGFFAIGGYASAFLTTFDLTKLKGEPLIAALLRAHLLTSRVDGAGSTILHVHPWVAALVAIIGFFATAGAAGVDFGTNSRDKNDVQMGGLIGIALASVLLSLLMYASPVIYPLQLVKDKLLVHQAAGEWSNALYTLYTLNPLAGIIDAFQSVVLRSEAPDLNAMIPGAIMIAILLPLSYLYFKRAESYFADVI